MFDSFHRETWRYTLELAGLVFLMIACYLHSWSWDAAGIALLVLATLLNPPAGWAGVAVGLSLRTAEPAQLTLNFNQPAIVARCAWAATPCGRATSVRAWEDCQ